MTQPAEPVRRARVVTRGKAEMIGEGLARLQRVADEAGVELVLDQDEAVKHGVDAGGDDDSADVTIVLGGDGTMLRALAALPWQGHARSSASTSARWAS